MNVQHHVSDTRKLVPDERMKTVHETILYVMYVNVKRIIYNCTFIIFYYSVFICSWPTSRNISLHCYCFLIKPAALFKIDSMFYSHYSSL